MGSPGSVRQEMRRLPTTDSEYVSPPGRISPLARTLPSFSFYRVLAGIVLRSGAKAKRGRYGSADWVKSSHEVLQALERVGVRFEISGIQHLESLETPCVVIGNHMSILETFVLPGVIQPIRPVTFIVKESSAMSCGLATRWRSRAPTPGRTSRR